jgi:molybdopterin-guanine dinucleotide biosynthesis protein A
MPKAILGGVTSPHHEPLAPRTAGIVLAGGQGTRLGAAAALVGGKAAVMLGGRTLLDWAVAALEPHVGRLVVVTAHPAAAAGRPPGLPTGSSAGPGPPGLTAIEVVRDTTPDGGPLAALADAVRHLMATGGDTAPVADEVVVVSCDMPLVRPAVVRLLLERLRASPARWAVAHVLGHPQVFPSALRTDLLSAIEAHLAAGRRDVRGLVGTLAAATPPGVVFLQAEDFAAVDPGLESFRDIDTPAELAAASRRLARRGPPRGSGTP